MANVIFTFTRKFSILLIVLCCSVNVVVFGQQNDPRQFLSPIPSTFLVPPPPVPAPIWNNHLPSQSFVKNSFAPASTSVEVDAQTVRRLPLQSAQSSNSINTFLPSDKDESRSSQFSSQSTILTPPAVNAFESNFDSSFSSLYSLEDYDDYVPYNSDRHDHFSWALLKNILQKEKDSNVVVSPFSIKLLMALLVEAAGDNSLTQQELYRTLEDDIKSPENLRGFYRKLLTSMKKENPYYSLSLETRIFANNHIEPRQRYSALLSTFYNTSIDRVAFRNVEHTVNYINSWASNATNGHITQLVNEENVKESQMLLTNAIYFMGLWRKEFNQSTHTRPFFLKENLQIPVNYMQQTDYYYYHEDDELNVKMLRLPYKGKKFAMFIVLPKSIDGLEEVVHNLKDEQLKRMQFLMEEVKVKVTMPKFRFEYSADLKSTLQQLGINEVFTDRASLPGLFHYETFEAKDTNGDGNLKVTGVIQKAGIEVNEKGTEAFAATLVEIDNKFGGAPSVEQFKVDRPFMFFIEEEATGSIIFAGKIRNPKN